MQQIVDENQKLFHSTDKRSKDFYLRALLIFLYPDSLVVLKDISQIMAKTSIAHNGNQTGIFFHLFHFHGFFREWEF